MSHKVTISVPDELHKKMQKWRHLFKPSKVFQESMTYLIEKKENFLKRVKEGEDMAATIKRLKKQKAAFEGKIEDRGRDEGIRFAKIADYEVLLEALKDLTMIDNGTEYLATKSLEGYFTEAAEGEGIEMFGEQRQITPEFSQWLNGWKQGVEAFWDEIKSKI